MTAWHYSTVSGDGWSPAQWNEDHPLSADERATEGRRSNWWSDAQNVGGAEIWGKVDSDRDFKKLRR
jgi:hypothetical protein